MKPNEPLGPCKPCSPKPSNDYKVGMPSNDYKVGMPNIVKVEIPDEHSPLHHMRKLVGEWVDAGCPGPPLPVKTKSSKLPWVLLFITITSMAAVVSKMVSEINQREEVITYLQGNNSEYVGQLNLSTARIQELEMFGAVYTETMLKAVERIQQLENQSK